MSVYESGLRLRRLTRGRCRTLDELPLVVKKRRKAEIFIIDDLVDIWTEAADLGGYSWDVPLDRRYWAVYYVSIAESSFPGVLPGPFLELENAAKRGGVDSMLAAYWAGVPVDDILGR